MKQKLHPGARWLFRFSGFYSVLFFTFLFFFGFIFMILRFFEETMELFISSIFLIIFLFIVFVIILIEVYARLAYNNWAYEFTDDNLKLERGIIWKRYSNVPYERVQNVDISRGILARMLGFSSVNIQTAGYSGGYSGRRGGGSSEGYIPAVSMEGAEKIREFLMKKISKRSKEGL